MSEYQRSSTNIPAANGASIIVLGAGNFGTCLAQHLAEKGYHVIIWSRSPEVVHAINTLHKNPKYLSTLNLSPRVSARSNIGAAELAAASVVVHATPTQTMRAVLRDLAPHWPAATLLVCAAKGIEIGTLALPGRIISEELGPHAAALATILSGPSFASEVVAHQPTAVTAASKTAASAQRVQELFHAEHFRVYSCSDPIGLEVAGALKNVVAIAAGAGVGLGFQMNSRAAIITRGLAEITRFGLALGAVPITFNGLGGVGDLFLTCTSEKSRNFSVGYRLGRGEDLASTLAAVGVAEGVATAKAAFALAQQLHVDAPLTTEVYRVLYEGKKIAAAVKDLLTREAKPEFNFPAT